MKFNSSNLTTELQTIYRSDQPKPEPLNYQKLIKKQQDVIKSLSNEILLLKSYVSLTFARQEALETAKKETSTKAALKDIAAVLGVSCEDSTAVLEAVKKNKELSIRRAEPIFV